MSEILATYQNLSKSYGADTLFQGFNFSIFKNQKIGFIGPNGVGKSTLLKVLSGIDEADTGNTSLKKGTKRVYLPQNETFPQEKTISQILEDTLTQNHIEEADKLYLISFYLTEGGFENPDQKVKELSGGWKKRLSIIKALIQEPDILFLDEPTNHLDLKGILWLENLLKKKNITYLLISHDRYFLNKTTNEIIELNPIFKDGYFKSDGNYDDYLKNKEHFIQEMQNKEANLKGKLKHELEWLQRGAKARTTKAKSRVQNAHALIESYKDIKKQNRSSQKMNLDFEYSNRNTKKLIELIKVHKSFGEKNILENFNLKISPNMKIGLLGHNGTGKTTLLKLMTKELEPSTGTVKHADFLKMSTFDQNRTIKDPNEPLRHIISNTGDTIVYQDKPLHIISWAKKFLFEPDQLDQPIKTLSGGEQAKALLARVMLEPADVLFLDEPTNDLDIPSLEALEDSLDLFPGAIVFVTHDRYFLEKLATHIIGFHNNGEVHIYSDFQQWDTAEKQSQSTEETKNLKTTKTETEKAAPTKNNKNPGKLSYKYQRELDMMEENILNAESHLEGLQQKLNQSQQNLNHSELQDLCDQITKSQEKVNQLYSRWEELENMKNGC